MSSHANRRDVPQHEQRRSTAVLRWQLAGHLSCRLSAARVASRVGAGSSAQGGGCSVGGLVGCGGLLSLWFALAHGTGCLLLCHGWWGAMRPEWASDPLAHALPFSPMAAKAACCPAFNRPGLHWTATNSHGSTKPSGGGGGSSGGGARRQRRWRHWRPQLPRDLADRLHPVCVE